MGHMLLLAALAALIATAPGGPAPARPQEPQPQPQGQQGRRGAGAGAAPEHGVEYGTEYGTEYEDDEAEEDDVNEDEYASSGQHGVEQLGDKPARPDQDQDQGPRRGRHVQHQHHQADGLGHRLEVANKATSAAPHVLFEETSLGGTWTCPPAPPPPVSRGGGGARCRAQRCAHDSDCAPGRRCCSNGCVHTCQLVADPPLVVDWEGETPDVLHPEMPVGLSAGHALPWPRPWARPKPLEYHQRAPEVVVLPGGCSLPPSQYQRIVAFMKGGSLKNCACRSGAVVCHVN